MFFNILPTAPLKLEFSTNPAKAVPADTALQISLPQPLQADKVEIRAKNTITQNRRTYSPNELKAIIQDYLRDGNMARVIYQHNVGSYGKFQRILKEAGVSTIPGEKYNNAQKRAALIEYFRDPDPVPYVPGTPRQDARAAWLHGVPYTGMLTWIKQVNDGTLIISGINDHLFNFWAEKPKSKPTTQTAEKLAVTPTLKKHRRKQTNPQRSSLS